MLSRIVICFCFILFSFFSFSQEKDPMAVEILKGVSVKYRSYKSLKATFKLTVSNLKDKTSENQTGTIIIKGNKYKLILPDQEIISDGNVVWTFLKDANEVQINESIEKPGSVTPNNIFTIYETGFDSKYVGEKNSSGKLIQHIELVPEDKKKSYFKVQLTINKSEKYVMSAKIFDKNGMHYIYNIDKFLPNPEAPDSLFTFNTTSHPGVEVIDLR